MKAVSCSQMCPVLPTNPGATLSFKTEESDQRSFPVSSGLLSFPWDHGVESRPVPCYRLRQWLIYQDQAGALTWAGGYRQQMLVGASAPCSL